MSFDSVQSRFAQDLSGGVEGHVNLNAGALIGAALDQNFAVHQVNSFSHSSQTNTVLQARFGQFESTAVVRNSQDDAVGGGFQRNGCSTRLAVLDDILEPFLRDSIEAKCCSRRDRF